MNCIHECLLSLRGAPGLQFSHLLLWVTSGLAKSVINLYSVYCLRALRTPTPTHTHNLSRRFLSMRILYCTCHVHCEVFAKSVLRLYSVYCTGRSASFHCNPVLRLSSLALRAGFAPVLHRFAALLPALHS